MMKPQQCDSEGTATTRLRQQHRDDAMTKATPQWQQRNCDRREGNTAMATMKP